LIFILFKPIQKKDKEFQEKGDRSFFAGLDALIKRDFVGALKFFEESLLVYKRASWPNVQCLARSLHHIGLVYKETQRLSEAIKNFEESLVLQKKYAEVNNYRISTTLRSMGVAYELQDKYEKALECYEEAQGLQKKMTDSKQSPTDIHPFVIFLLKTNTLYSMGSIYAKLNKPTLAIEFLNECLKLQRSEKIGLEFL
jgi:tetratricopeptide (TPR) repeat protein